MVNPNSSLRSSNTRLTSPQQSRNSGALCVGAMWGVMSHMTTEHTCTNVWGLCGGSWVTWLQYSTHTPMCGGYVGSHMSHDYSTHMHQCVGAMWGVHRSHDYSAHTNMWGLCGGFIGHMTTVHTPTLTVWSVVSLGVWYAHVWLGSLKELAPQCSHTLRVCSRVHWQLLLTLTLTQLILQDRKLATKCIFIKVMAYQSCSENRPKSEKAPIRRLT